MDGWMDGRITVIIVCNLLEFRSNFFSIFMISVTVCGTDEYAQWTYSVSQKILFLLRFLKFFKWLKIFEQNFTCLLYVHIYSKLENFIQLSLNLTKLCHISATTQ